MAKPTLYKPVDNVTHTQLMATYGTFMVLWGVFESVLELAIERETSIKPLHSIIILSGLGFERKAAIARSLLALNPTKASAIPIINKITKEAGRNAIVHGQLHVGHKHLEFVKHRTDQTLKTSVVSFTAPQFIELVKKVSALLGDLQDALDIQDDDLITHSNSTKNLWDKAAPSSNPSSST